MSSAEDGVSSKNWVWAPVGDFFEKGFVSDYSPDGTCIVTISGDGRETSMSFKQDQLENCNPSKFNKCDDMAELTHLNEPSVVYNLHLRYADDLIYTYSGLFLVAINPYKPLNIYDNATLNRYHINNEKSAPHIFATAEGTLRNLLANSKDQSILVTGESGAGKTENTKKIIQYLSSIPHAPTGLASPSSKLSTNTLEARMSNIETRILQANPILESFGNAKTIKNNNSSRFGKFIRIFFSSAGSINGANIDYYLLEKSRVVQQSPQERNYHVFYQFLKGYDQLHMLGLSKDCSSYKYLNASQIDIPQVDDFKEYNLLLDALRIMGFSQDEISSMFELIAVILHLGNLDFSSWKSEQANFTPESPVESISKLLGISSLAFATNLLKPKVKAGRELVEKSRKPAEAKYAIDALAKHMYEKLFEFIISKINQNLQLNSSFEREKLNFIGVLDIAGFEIFDVNSFEQLCINYTNEKLQQFFNHHSFILEQSEYLREDIQWEFIDFGQDLQPTIDLIETTSPMGVFKILDEECLMPKSSDKSFMERLSKEWGRGQSTKFEENKFKSGFFIHHYAGKVEYNIDSWLQKNTDPVSEHVLKLFTASSNKFIKELFASDDHLSAPAKGRGLKRRTASRKHKDQLGNLMDQLESTEPHFVRCILPNLEKKPNFLDKALVLQQLRCNGVLEGIRITRAGYPNRMNFDEFAERYSILIDKDALITSMRTNCEMIIKRAKLDSDTFKIGITKIFFKNGILGKLEELRDVRMKSIFTKFQSLARGFSARNRLRGEIQRIQAAKLIARTFKQVRELLDENPWLDLYTKIKPMLEDSIKVLDSKELNDKLKLTSLDLEGARKEYSLLKGENEALQTQLTDATAEVIAIKKLMAEHDKKIEESDRLKNTIEAKLSKSESLAKDLKAQLQKSIKEQDASEKRHRDLSDQLSEKLQEIETLKVTHAELLARVASLTEANKSLSETNDLQKSIISNLELKSLESTESLELELLKVNSEKADLESELLRLKDVEANGKVLETALANLKQENVDLTGKLEHASEVEQKYTALQDEFTLIKKENESHEARFALLSERNAELEKDLVSASQAKDEEISQLGKENEILRSTEEKITNDRKRLEDLVSDLEAKIETNEKVLSENGALSGTIEVLKAELTSQKEELVLTVKALSASKETAAARENKTSDLEIQLTSYQKQIKQLESHSKQTQERASKAESEAEDLLTRISEQEKAITRLQTHLANTKQQLASLESEFEENKTQLLLASAENGKLSTEVGELRSDMERLSNVESEITRAKENATARESQITSLESRLKVMARDKNDLDQQLNLLKGEHEALLALSESRSQEIATLKHHIDTLEQETARLAVNQGDRRFVEEFAEIKLKLNEASAELRKQKFENKLVSEELAMLKERSASAAIKRETSFQRSLNGKVVVDLTGSEEVLKEEIDTLRAQLHREEANSLRAETYAILLQKKLNKLQATRGLPSWTDYEKKYKDAEARIQQLEREYEVGGTDQASAIVSRSESFSRTQLVNLQLAGASQEFIEIYKDITTTLKSTREELSTTKSEVLRLKRLLNESEDELYKATRLGLQMSVARYDEEMAELKVRADRMSSKAAELELDASLHKKRAEEYLSKLESAENAVSISQKNEEAAQRELDETRVQMTLAREEARAAQIVVKESRKANSVLEIQIEDHKFKQRQLENQIKAIREKLDYANTTYSNGDVNAKYREEISVLHKDLNFKMQNEVALIKETKRLLLDLEETQGLLKALEQDHLNLISKYQRASGDLATSTEKSRQLERDNSAYESKIISQTKQITSLKDVMEEVITQRDELLEQKANLEEEVVKVNDALEESHSQIVTLKNDMTVMRDHLENYQKEILSLQAELHTSKAESLNSLQDQTKFRKELLVACEENESLKRVNRQLSEKTARLEEELYSNEQLKFWKSKIEELSQELDESELQRHQANKSIKLLEKSVRELEHRHEMEKRRARKLNDENFDYQNNVNKIQGTIKALHADYLENKVQLKSYERENNELRNNLLQLEREIMELQTRNDRSR